MPIKDMFQKIPFVYSLPAIILSTLAVVIIVLAQTEPSQAPPGGNTPAPLNVGSTTQYKSGALGVGGLFRAYTNAIFDGLVGVGTTNPSQKLDVAGYVKGQSGLCIGSDCRTEWPKPGTFCNSITTGTSERTSTGISILINDVNICEDDNGCTYEIWAYSDAKPAGADFYASAPVMFRQKNVNGVHYWYDVQGNDTGINGDTIEETIAPDWHGFKMVDESALVDVIVDGRRISMNGNPDYLVLTDNSTTYGFVLTVCDY